MRIAVVSDTHSRTAAIRQALEMIGQRGIQLIVHCGDIEDDDAVRLFPAFTHFVLGNCDADRDGIRAAIEDIGATLHEPSGRLDIAGKAIAFVHGHEARLMRDLIQAAAFDYVFHGHTHVPRDERTGRTRVINPGALHRARPKTFVILDVATGETETVIMQ
jgi:putative phosphoesterase